MKQKYEYNHILEDAFNRVKNIKKGVLFECIGILEPIHANEIREQFNIRSSDSYRDDLRVLKEISFLNPILEIISLIVSNPISSLGHNILMFLPSSSPSSSPSDCTTSTNTESQCSSVESSSPVNHVLSQTKHFFSHISPTIAIVMIALAVIGLYFIGQSKKNSSEKGNDSTSKFSRDESLPETWDEQSSYQEDERTMPQQGLKRSADLCLVVPCNCIATDLRGQMDQGKELLADDTSTLVEKSAYFLVTKSREEPMFQLDKNFKDFPEDGYLFIRLRISDKENLMKIDLPGSLSRAISSQEPMVIQEIGLRQDFSNLDKFHRA